MKKDHFKYMKLALKAESRSDHANHNVGALIHGKHNNGDRYEIARSNFSPKILKDNIGKDNKLGNASITVHAEIAAICAAPATDGADIYITDLPCPNCAKVIAEARIKNVYIDSHTHNTPLGLKIKPYFDDVSSLIFKHANINVFEMDVGKETIKQIINAVPNALTSIHHPIVHLPINNSDVNPTAFLKMVKHQKCNTNFAACITKSLLGQYGFLFAQEHRSIGLSKEDAASIENIQNKYKPTLQPINRLLLNCARHGVKILPNHLYSNQTPTSREFVNMIGAGYTNITIGERNKCRDKWGLKALEQLDACSIL